ncbi:MAG: hypothetical protein H5T86_13140 [Armatimonadetes bacterium]|nr:hypothetical protein [Armatimonadota bacterium]
MYKRRFSLISITMVGVLMGAVALVRSAGSKPDLEALLKQADVKFVTLSDGTIVAPWRGDAGSWMVIIAYDDETHVIVTAVQVCKIERSRLDGGLASKLLELNGTSYPVKTALAGDTVCAASGIPANMATPQLLRYICEATVAMADAVKSVVSGDVT